jgi:hypothetical protein
LPIRQNNDEHYYIIGILNDVEKIAKERNEMLHSIIKEHPDGKIMQHNPNNNASKEVNYENVKSLADDLFDLRTDVVTIFYDISFRRLLESSKENNDSVYRRLKNIIYHKFKSLLDYVNKIWHK